MISVLIKRGNLDRDTPTWSTPDEYEGGHQGDTSTSQGIPQDWNKPPEPRRRAWNRVSFTALRWNQPC